MVSDERVACDGPNLFEKFSKTVPCKEEASHCAAQCSSPARIDSGAFHGPPKAWKVDVLATFRRLQAECLRVYAELLTVVALTGAQETQTEEPLAEAGNNRCREKAEKRREPRCVCPGWGSSAINIGSGAPLRGTVTTKPGGYTW
eukprot:s1111_g23.t2